MKRAMMLLLFLLMTHHGLNNWKYVLRQAVRGCAVPIEVVRF